MTGRVENQVVAEATLEEHSGGVNGDALRLLVLESVEQKRILEGFRVQLSLGPNLLQLPLRKGMRVGEEATNHGALAVIDVAHDHDVHPLLTVGRGRGGSLQRGMR